MTSAIPESRSVLVTGGAGFIGSELVRQLVELGHRVVAVDSLVNGRREHLQGLPQDRCRLVVADVRDRTAVQPLLGAADVVFHLACLGVRHSIHSPRENHEVNATATLELVEAARHLSVPRFVYVSSSEVYGTASRVPMAEDQPTSPTTVYGASKLAGECYALAAWRTHGYPVVVVRPFNTYGPRSHHEGDSGEVIPKFMLRALAGQPLVLFGDGAQTRDFTFVADTARGILGAGFAPDVVGEVINLGNGRETAIGDLAREVGRIVERDVRIEYAAPRPGDVGRLLADVGKARERLGFQPSYSLQDGLRALRGWYESQPETPQALLAREVLINWTREGAEGGR